MIDNKENINNGLNEVSDATLLEGGDNSREKLQVGASENISRSRVSQGKETCDFVMTDLIDQDHHKLEVGSRHGEQNNHANR